jgi:hypothetical protein
MPGSRLLSLAVSLDDALQLKDGEAIETSQDREPPERLQGKARSYLVLSKRSAVETPPFNVEIAGLRPVTSEELERGHTYEQDTSTKTAIQTCRVRRYFIPPEVPRSHNLRFGEHIQNSWLEPVRSHTAGA